jgi:ATP-dependent Clp protease ATP-binding subunit ClpC
MFERFTDQSRRAVVLAQEEARLLDHNYIGTEHLLAGLAREKRGAGARALTSAGITLDAVRGRIETRSGRGQRPQSGHIPFTPRAKKCLELALREAVTLGHGAVSTGHLLLGLLGADDCAAVQILAELGADLGQLRTQVITEIEDHPEGREYSPPIRVRPAWRPEAAERVDELLDEIDRRLTAIERHLGIAQPDAAGGSGPETADGGAEADGPEADGPEAAGAG